MSDSVGRIALDLEVNSSGFKKQMNGITKTAQGQTSGLVKMFKKVGVAAAAAFSVKAIVGFSKSCIQLGSDLAEIQNVVDSTFGSMSSSVNQWAKDAMTAYGLSEKTAKEYVGQLGAMSKAFGNSNEEAYKQATSLAGLVGDVASFYNLSTDEAFTKLKAVYTGETEALKSLGVVMTQAALDEYALAEGYGKTTAKMSEQEKVALRLSFVQARLATASGDFARTSNGWANQTRVLALRFDALKASIGQGLIAALRPAIVMLNKLMVYLQGAADAFRDFMVAIFGDAGSVSSGSSSLGDALASGSGELSSNMGDAASSAKAIKKSLAGFDQINILSSGSDDAAGAGSGTGGTSLPTDSIEPGLSAGASSAEKLKGFLNDIKTKLGEIKAKIVEFTQVSGLAGLWDDFLIDVGNAKSGIVTLFDIFKDSVSNVAPNLDALKSSFSNTFLTIFQTVTTIWGDMWVSLSAGFKSFVEENRADLETALTNYMTIFAGLWTFISDVVGDIYASLKSWWEADGKRIFDEMIQVIKDIGQWILKLWNTWISPVLATIMAALTELWNNHLKPLWDEILAFITSVWNSLKAFWDNILKPIVDWVIENLGPVFVPLMNGVVNTIKTAIATITDVIKGIITTLRGVLDFLTGVFTGDWNKAWNGLKTAFSGVCDVFKALWKGVKDTFITTWNAIKTAGANAWTAIKQVFAPVVSWFKEKVITPVKNAFSGGWDGVKSGAKSAWSGVKSAFSSANSWFKEKVTSPVKDEFGKVWSKLKSGASGAWSKLKSGASDAWSGIKDTFKKIPEWFKDKFSDAWTNVKNVFSTGGKIFDGIKDGIVSAFTKVVNAIIRGINKVIATPFNTINGVLDKIRNFKILGNQPFANLGSISVPQIPQLASGGYVKANTPQLAIIGDNRREGEIVAPESKITEAVVAAFRQFLPMFGGGNKQPIYLTVKLGDGTFWEGFVDYHNDIVRRTGDTPLLV